MQTQASLGTKQVGLIPHQAIMVQHVVVLGITVRMSVARARERLTVGPHGQQTARLGTLRCRSHCCSRTTLVPHEDAFLEGCGWHSGLQSFLETPYAYVFRGDGDLVVLRCSELGPLLDYKLGQPRADEASGFQGAMLLHALQLATTPGSCG